ncbi:MAG: DUF4157 domain-containing protein [Spirochaetales bacterium]|nr:DUF4157 domain-containing protein [Spirochaetales bacterium]
MRNDYFYEHRRFSRKKTKDTSKKSNSFHPYQKDYSLGDFLSDIGNREIQNFFETGLVQAKLNISQPCDIYEQEADRIANAIVSSDINQLPKVNRIQAKFAKNNITVQSNTESKIKSLQDRGNPLNKSVKDYFEPRFGIDLGNVKVHTDNNANLLARSINARAFTYGNDIVFGQGQFQPETTTGKKLIAHELTHTIQQGQNNNVIHRDANPYIDTNEVFFVSDPAHYTSTIIDYLPKNTGLDIISFGLNQSFNAHLSDKSLEWWQVEVISCTNAGLLSSRGWVMKKFITTTYPLHETDFSNPDTWNAYSTWITITQPRIERITQEVNDGVKKLDINAPASAWTALTWNDIQARAIELLFYPERVNQGNHSLCGPASVLNILTDLQPTKFADLVIEIYRDGTVNGRNINNTLLTQPLTIVQSSSTRPCDWMLLSAIRDVSQGAGYSGNPNGSFPFDWEEWRGLTYPWEMNDSINQLIDNVDIEEKPSYTIYEPTEKELMDINGLLTNNPNSSAVIMLIEANLIDDPDSFFSIPNHWVRLLSPISISGTGDKKSISFSLFSWGRIYSRTRTLQEFKRHTRHLYIITNIGAK